MIEFEIKPAGRFSFGFEEFWKYRELIYFFAWRDIKLKYKQTFLGAMWAVLQPLLLMLIFTFFFSRAFKGSISETPYPVFVFSGLLLWNMFASGVSGAGQSMVSNAHIIKKIYFPRLIIPVSSVISSLADFTMALIVYFALLFFYRYQFLIPHLILVLPISVFICIFCSFGLGALLSALNVKYRDFRYVIPFMIQVLMFLSPVIYPVSMFHSEMIRQLLELNPMAGSIEVLRSVVNQTGLNWILIIKSIVISLILFFAGIYYFRKTEYYFADIA